MDDQGHFFITDRVKELIKYKGFQVAPAELEDCLLGHKDIVDAAVIGVYSDNDATELPRAYVVLQRNATESDDLKQDIANFIHQKLAPYKRLRGGIFFVKEIPKTASGKILRRVLRDRVKSNL